MHETNFLNIISFTAKRAKAIAIEDLFEFKDERIRVECEVLNIESNQSFTANALCDGGANSEFSLPARKIVQLGLKPYGNVSFSKGSTNHIKSIIKFAPAVSVTLKFLREGEETVVERTALLVASCHKDEYDEEIIKNTTTTTTTVSNKRKSSEISDFSSSSVEKVKVVKLSPVSHRPPSSPNDRVVLGQNGLAKLFVHANFTDRVLEIEEEIIYDE
jgi:predicted aspartyl protease